MKPFSRGLFVLVLLLSWSTWTKAEYRAFLLQIRTTPAKPGDPEDPPVLIKSSLDPWQYKGYYPVKDTQTISYIDTWRCPGRTGGMQPTCKSPKEIAAEKEQESKANGESPERKPANN